MDLSGVVTFEVMTEEEGGYSAHARVGTYSMITQGDTLDELRAMITQLVEDFNAHEAKRIYAYALLFSAGNPLAA